MAIVDAGDTVMMQVLPSWIYTGRIHQVVLDPLVPELSYCVVEQCCWIERCANHVVLISESDPHKHPQLQSRLFAGMKKIALTKITSVDHMEVLPSRTQG